jgi:hypothetical protein
MSLRIGTPYAALIRFLADAGTRHTADIELNGVLQPRILIDCGSDTRRNIRRDGLDVIRIGHIGADGFSHQFARDVSAIVAKVLRAGEIAGAFLAGVQRVVETAELSIETLDVYPARHLVDNMADFVCNNAGAPRLI